MKLYFASDIRHAKKWIEFRSILSPTVRVVSTWIDFLKNGEPKISPELIKKSWDHNIQDIILCDALLLYVEHGDRMRGSLFEAGIAFGQGKMVHYVGDTNLLGTMRCCFEPSLEIAEAIEKMLMEVLNVK